MNRRPALLTLAYGLMGLLAISALLITFARKTGSTEPSIGSFGPSGLSLFSQLLREAGYEVSATRDPTPFLDPKRDVPVAVTFNEQSFELWDQSEKQDPIGEQLRKFAEKGGLIIDGRMKRDFGSTTRSSRPIDVRAGYSEATAKVHFDPSMILGPEWVHSEPETTQLWLTPGQTIVSLSSIGAGKGLFFLDFSTATNRFIDQADNAPVLLASIQASVPKGSRLVFLEAAWGNASEPGLFEAIGEWAAAGWSQALILGLVIVYTLGRPFGLPEAKRPGQRGQRELVDAYSSLLRRAEATDIAMQAVLTDADRRLRKAMKMDSGLDIEERNKRLPPELVDLLAQVERACQMQVPTDVATSLGNRLDAAVSEFAGDRRVAVRKRKKS